tara:strand:- start:390 stop:1235 length:846 start_codon:yes stop_codon:yes gene_type:complete
MTNIITINERINLQSSLDGGQAFRWHNNKGKYRGVIGNQVLTISNENNIIKIENNSMNKENLNKLNLKSYLGLGTNQDYLKIKYKDNKYLSKLINLNDDLKILSQDPWEVIIGFITSSVSNISKIKKCMNSLSILGGDRIGSSDYDYIFPDARKILDIGEENLRKLGFGFRAPYIIDASNKVINKELEIEKIIKYDYKNQLQSLTKVNGIGRKVADCILTYGFSRRDTFPVDRWVRKGLISNLGFNKNLNNEKLAEKARLKFKTDSAYIQQYIFYGEKTSL